jgi:hypothetical protein
MAIVPESRPIELALRRRTPVLRPLAWLVCWLLEMPSMDDLDQAALDAHIAALAEQDRDTASVPGPAGTEHL